MVQNRLPSLALTVGLCLIAAVARSEASDLVGAGSCAASACHGGTGSRGEHNFWIRRDPHARAYEILFDKPAADMQKRLARTVPAHQDHRCLGCHVGPEFARSSPPGAAAYFKTDGVSCESCHGPARNWLNEHHLAPWQTMSAQEKTRKGMRDTRSPAGRADVCVRCHVGMPGMEVDHDLIAAGHPRLHFEFAAYHAALPGHWPTEKDRVWPRGGADWDARAWMVGQLAVARAALDLLADRAGDAKHAWPEFADYDCAACHHPLQARQVKEFGKRRPGALPWGSQVALSSLALDGFPKDVRVDDYRAALADVQAAMDRGPVADRRVVAGKATIAAARLQAVRAGLDCRLPAQLPLARLFADLLEVHGPRAAGADAATQIHLGLAALHQARVDTKSALPARDLHDALRRLSMKLGHADRAVAPASYDPCSLRARLIPFHAIGTKRTP